MPGFDHVPIETEEPENEEFAARRARYGLILFVLYLLLYGGFMLLNAFAREVMERTPIAGVNLAILYGLGLILAAFGLALVYAWLCRASAEDLQQLPPGGDRS